MRKIIIELSGRNIQEIYSTEKENDAVAIYVIDWDNINAGQTEEIDEFPIKYVTRNEAQEIIDEVNEEIEERKSEDWRL